MSVSVPHNFSLHDQYVNLLNEVFRGHVHIHVATHNIKSTLRGWVGLYVNLSTLSCGNLTIIVLSLYYCSTAFLFVLSKYSQVNMIEIQIKNIIEYRLTEY
jgi:hypothetical protein